MKTKTINLYEYHELSPKAKQKALDEWNRDNADPFMQSHMINLLKEELEERKIKYDVDSIDVRYSLSNSQGDGFMFIGSLEWKGHNVKIEHHDNHYCHMYTAQFDWPDFVGEDKESEEEKIASEFKSEYQDICEKLERIGYAEIEYNESEEAFIETCEANGYTFRENGEMENA